MHVGDIKSGIFKNISSDIHLLARVQKLVSDSGIIREPRIFPWLMATTILIRSWLLVCSWVLSICELEGAGSPTWHHQHSRPGTATPVYHLLLPFHYCPSRCGTWLSFSLETHLLWGRFCDR